MLTLHFTLPLKAPVKAKDLTLEVYDREFFVDFSFAEKDPGEARRRAGAMQALGRAAAGHGRRARRSSLSQLGPDQSDPSLTIGAEYANKISVKCP